MAADPQHSDFIAVIRQSCAEGIPVLQRAFGHLQEWDLLGYAAAITPDDFDGENARLTKDEVVAAVEAIRGLQAALAANGAAGLKALLRAAR